MSANRSRIQYTAIELSDDGVIFRVGDASLPL